MRRSAKTNARYPRTEVRKVAAVSAAIVAVSQRRLTIVGRLYQPPGQFLSAAAGAGEDTAAGKSEFQVSVPHFHVPPFFSQTSQYLPRSLVPSFMVNS